GEIVLPLMPEPLRRLPSPAKSTNRGERDTMQPGRYVHLAVLAGALALAGWSGRPARADIPNWMEKTVGTSTQGSASVANGVWTIKGSGNDLWGTEDDFEIVAKSLPGDGSVTTKLLGAESGMDLAKVGVMMREDLDDVAAKTMVLDMEGGTHGGEELFRALTGDRMGKDRKMAVDGGSGLFP